MAFNGSEVYRTPLAFRTSANQRIKAVAKQAGRLPGEVQREFIIQRFLTVLFSEPGRPWVVKGGASLAVRLPEARHSRDVDLLALGDADQAVALLREHTRAHPDDLIAFEVGEPIQGSQQAGATFKVKVVAYVDTVRWDTFPIDLDCHRGLVGEPDQVTPTPVIEVPGMPAPPTISVFPLANQIADKVCAMYEPHATGPSTRYHDLVDLVLILRDQEFPAEGVAAALVSEEIRRRFQLPEFLAAPGPQWEAGYAAVAKGSPLPVEFHQLASALDFVGRHLNQLLPRQ
jgi:hypothetical protein